MPLPPLKVDLYYDIGSPKSWVALELLLRYAPVWNLQLELQPGLLGAVHKLTGNQAPGANPYKGAHLVSSSSRVVVAIFTGGLVGQALDLQRDFTNNKLKGGIPPFFGGPEHNFLHCARLLRAIKTSCPADKLMGATRALFTQCWTNFVPPTKPEFFACLVPSVFSEQQLQDLLAKSASTENKNGLKSDTETLVEEHGAFGFPWIIVHMPDGHKEAFFGADRMESMSYVLGPEYKYSGPWPTAPSRL
ncbi:thioredoxin-like protein [Exidia glandulosa HHB12029]|uniref:Thioredoxin-like protein n=1 Tax=Exidia glandulosa HHB12029 TaxID=1314781 RepID=A0A165Q0R4_EXIGL|nr:thioredoxin-like protein [Exidia glandulosa HHB12029]